jgi:transcriptional regulator with XRE-family HTH domain
LSVRSSALLAAKDWELWVAETIADLIADGRPGTESEPTTQIVARTLSVIMESMFDGNVAKFARTIGKQKNTVWGWLHGNSKMLLRDLVNLCYCLQITLRDFLSGSLSPEHLSVADFRPSLIKVERRVPSRQLNRGILEQNLLNILDHQPVPSMQQVARLLGVDKRLLYRHFSEICRAIADKHKQASITGNRPIPNSPPR